MAGTTVLSTVFFLLGALIFLLGLIIFREAPRQRVNLAVSMMLFSAGFGAVLGASGLVAESQSLTAGRTDTSSGLSRTCGSSSFPSWFSSP